MSLRKPNLTVRLEIAALACLILPLFLSACSRLARSQAPSESPPPFEVRLELDKNAYRPGEIVACKVKIVSLLDDDLLVAPLQPVENRSAANLNFYMGRWGDPIDAVRRIPVQFDPPGKRFQPIEIAARGKIEEKFSFVTLTQAPGDYKLQAHYTTSLQLTHQENKIVVSTPVKYTVKGKPLFRRDANGLIVEEDAVRAAVDAYGKLARETRAILVPYERPGGGPADEDSGLLMWWVTIEKMPSDIGAGESSRAAYHVSPYGGQVRPASKAFMWKPKEEAKPMPVRKSTPMPGAKTGSAGRN
ncbi:hypothetical protein JW916_04585 [Candidatus Sumerlaeota bacterium]|nr:hypothetical protein [Candidatus Sumerlaeota bacterium]